MEQSTSRITLSYVALLILMGVVGYLVTGLQSVTALIPAFFGLVVLVLWLVLRQPLGPAKLPWLLIVLAAIGFLATVSGIPKVISLVAGEETARPAAAISQCIMAILSFAYGLAVLLASRNRQAT